MKIHCYDTGEVVHSYSSYLKTLHWKQLREMAFQKAKGKCKNCKKALTNGFICHHDSTGAYKRIGRERISHWLLPDDVLAVCPNCHDGKYHSLLHWKVKVPDWAKLNKTEN